MDMCFACHRTILLRLYWTSTLTRSAGSDPEEPHAPAGLTWSDAILTSSASTQPQLNPSRRTMINGRLSWIWLTQRTTRERAPCTRHDDDDDGSTRWVWSELQIIVNKVYFPHLTPYLTKFRLHLTATILNLWLVGTCFRKRISLGFCLPDVVLVK